MAQLKLRGFKDNYATLSNSVNIAQYKPIDNINKVVAILKSRNDLKRFFQRNNEYNFIFKNGNIKIALNQLLKIWFIAENSTGLNHLGYFNLQKTYKHFVGIKRQSFVENNKGIIKYSYQDSLMFDATDNNLNSELKTLIHSI